MMRTDYHLKTMVLMILIAKKMNMLMMIRLKVKKVTMILAIRAVNRMNMLMMTSKMKMMIALAVRKTRILTTTRQTLEAALNPTMMAHKLLILQKQQEPDFNNAGIVLLLDHQDLLQLYLLHQDLPETFLDGCLHEETLSDTLLDT